MIQNLKKSVKKKGSMSVSEKKQIKKTGNRMEEEGWGSWFDLKVGVGTDKRRKRAEPGLLGVCDVTGLPQKKKKQQQWTWIDKIGQEIRLI